MDIIQQMQHHHFYQGYNAFKTGAGWIAELFVGLVSIWPLLFIGCADYFGWRRLKSAKVITQKS